MTDNETFADPMKPNDALRVSRERIAGGDLDGAEQALRWALDFNPGSAPLLSGLGDIAARRGQHDVAIDLTKRGVEANPADLSVRYQLSRLYLQQGDFVEAEAATRKALELAPNNAVFMRRMSEIAAGRGDFDGAFEWADRAVAANAADPRSHNHQAALHLQQGNLAEAERAARRGLDLAPKDVGLMRRMSQIAGRHGDFDGALVWTDQAVVANPADPQSHHHQAALHLQQGNLAEAEKAVRRGLDLAPKDVGLMRRMSQIAGRLGDFDGALLWANQAVVANPADPQSHHHQAALHLQQGNLPEAEKAVRRGLDLAPKDVGLMRRMSQIAGRRGDFDGAFEWADRAAAANPADPQSHNHQAALHLQQGSLTEAEKAVRKGLSLAPKDAGLMRRMSEIAGRRGDFDGAFEWADKAAAANPADPHSHNHQAALHLQQGNLAEAENAVRQGLDLAPKDAGLMRRMSEIAGRRGDFDGALVWADQAVVANPGDPHSYSHLAMLHIQKGNLMRALTAVRRALDLSPDDPTLNSRANYLASAVRRSDEAR